MTFRTLNILLQVTGVLFIFKPFFPLSFILRGYMALYSSALIFFFSASNLMLSPSSKCFISDKNFSSKTSILFSFVISFLHICIFDIYIVFQIMALIYNLCFKVPVCWFHHLCHFSVYFYWLIFLWLGLIFACFIECLVLFKIFILDIMVAMLLSF